MRGPLPMTEADFQGRIIDAAKVHGWRVAHFRPAKTARGWRTPMQGDVGFPDLVLARRGVLVLAELKDATRRVEPEQQLWLDQLGSHGRLWRPKDWPAVLAEITLKEAA